MNKEEFLARVSNAWDMGLCDPVVLRLADVWCDAVMRYEGGQVHYWVDFLKDEYERLDRLGV